MNIIYVSLHSFQMSAGMFKPLSSFPTQCDVVLSQQEAAASDKSLLAGRAQKRSSAVEENVA